MKQERYIRQSILPGFGPEAQSKLAAAQVLVIGAGGLGCPVLQYLAAAGIGNLAVMDADTVSISNLHRQVLFTEADLGINKAEAAVARLRLHNSEIQLSAYPFALTRFNALDILEKYDLIIDATDNFVAKYLVNDACVLLHKPFVYGAVSGYQGQVCLFNVHRPVNQEERPVNYRDLFPVPPAAGEILTCAQTGVLGPLCGIIGNIQAAEAIKYITGIGHLLEGRLFTYHLAEARGYEIQLKTDPLNGAMDRETFYQLDMEMPCDDPDDIPEIQVDAFKKLCHDPGNYIVDVREYREYPPIDFADARIPMSELDKAIDGLPQKSIYLLCHQGVRSIHAARMIRERRNLPVFSLKGGLTAYFK